MYDKEREKTSITYGKKEKKRKEIYILFVKVNSKE
jgi:hypothetical protein